MVNSELFRKRLQEVMDFYELNASKLSEQIGIQRSSISHLLSGRNKPSLDLVLKILKQYPKINFEWMVLGEGENPFIEKKDTPTLFDTEETIKEKKIITQRNIKIEQNTSLPTDTNVEKIILLYNDGSFKEFDKR